MQMYHPIMTTVCQQVFSIAKIYRYSKDIEENTILKISIYNLLNSLTVSYMNDKCFNETLY